MSDDERFPIGPDDGSSLLSRLWRRPLGRVAVLAVVILAALSVANTILFTTGPSQPVGTGNDPQDQYQVTIANERGDLVNGFIRAPDHIQLSVGRPSAVSITVCGAKVASADCAADHSRPSRGSNTPIMVGARIQARLTSDAPQCTIVASSSEVQPVINATDMATWSWSVTPASTGQFTLTVHLRVLEGETDQPLLADRAVEISMDVSQTAGSVLDSIGNGIKGTLVTIGAVLGGLGLSVAALWTPIGKRLRGHKANPVNRLRRRPGQRAGRRPQSRKIPFHKPSSPED
ncbi:hypothetical protein JJ691_22030 [Kutzneria sp. CA-103260]|nr:hypothetical protein JJ691_22030 [Kutzneria sp. CA-103260]